MTDFIEIRYYEPKRQIMDTFITFRELSYPICISECPSLAWEREWNSPPNLVGLESDEKIDFSLFYLIN